MTLTTPTSELALTWDLSDLYSGPDDPRIAEALDRATRDAEAYASRFRGTIDVPGGPAPTHLRDALTSLERVIEGVERVDAYSHMIFSADTTKEAHRDLEQKVRVQSTAIQNLLVFFELEWQKVEDADAERIMAAPELARYAYYLRRERQNRPHTLSEPEEKIMTEMRVTGASAWRGLFTELIAGLKFPMERDGVTKDMTLAELMSLVRDPDRSVRQRAYDTQYRVLRQHDQVLTYIYNTLVQEKRSVDRLRQFPNPMASRHLSNDLDPAIVETMLTAVEANAGTAQEYFRLKAKLLKLPKLAIYDQYAPIGGDAETCDYPTARASILDAFTAFTPGFGDLARQFFDKRWIDAEVRPGKIGGAYCMSITPRQHPYILCNYTGNLRDVLTVAHELGHGLHGMLARGQSDFEYHSSLALAETASVFGEILVFERLVDAASTPQAKIGLLGGKIEDIFATVFRQTTLTRFEQFAFARQQKNRLTPEGLGDDWVEANRRYYGDSVEMDENYRWGWSYIPHFINSPFYCYAYSFGELLVLALYRTYQEQGQSFIPRYVELLSRGGSGSPEELLAPLGVDIADPRFWSKGFVEIDRLIGKMRELVDAVAAS
jgi:oligoendopeptidase F